MLRRRVTAPACPLRRSHASARLAAAPLSDPRSQSTIITGHPRTPLECSARHYASNIRGCNYHIDGGLYAATPVRRYSYNPPGSNSDETSRLPWYHRTAGGSSGAASAAPAAANTNAPTPPTGSSDGGGGENTLDEASWFSGASASSANKSKVASVSPQGAAASPSRPHPSASASSVVEPPQAAAARSVSDGGASSPAAAARSLPSPSTSLPPASVVATAGDTAPSFMPPPSSSLSATPSTPRHAVSVPSFLPVSVSPIGRLSPLRGPSLDARVEDLIKVEEAFFTEATLPAVVHRLIDAKADAVERISMGDFVAMQPKRRLVALGGRADWLQWLEQSPYFQQAARLSAESPAADLGALQQAGIHTLQQWLEHPQLVKVSARTRTALDAAVAQSVEAYMAEVAALVNVSAAVEERLTQWMSDVVGRFVLDSLQVPLDRASNAMRTHRASWMPSDTLSDTGFTSPLSSSSSGRRGGTNTNTGILPAGECCTLDHYLRFVQKVLSSVRQDYAANHAAMGQGSINPQGDAQAELEVAERTHGVIAAALTQLLEQAVQHHLPAELAPLQQHGYLALDRLPGLLKRAASLLQMRSVPVRYFVFHTAVDASTGAAATATAAAAAASAESVGDAGGLTMHAPPRYPPGTFLVGSKELDVKLGEWSGQPSPPSSMARDATTTPMSAAASAAGRGESDNATEQEYRALLHRLRRRVDTLAVTSLYEVLAQPERYGGEGFSAANAIGLDHLFGPAKLLEERLTSALHYPAAAAERPLHFIEAGPLAGKTALLESLSRRTSRPGDKVVLVRYSGSSTPYLPDVDDHPVAFAARFWFRVALSSCSYWIKTEELFSRAPRSVVWWGHEKNWSWERYQSLLLSAQHAGTGHRRYQQQQQQERPSASTSSSLSSSSTAQLSAILVDDVDRALGPMQQRWGGAAAVSSFVQRNGTSSAGNMTRLDPSALLAALRAAQAAQAAAQNDMKAEVEEEEDEGEEERNAERGREEGNSGGTLSAANRSGMSASSSSYTTLAVSAAQSATALEEQQAHLLVNLWLTTGKSIEEHLASCFTQLSAAVGQVGLVFTGSAVPSLLLSYAAAPCRRYYLPLSGGVGLQARLRVLPLLATLHALHLTHHLDMPGLLYEVLKNCPAVAGKALELFWMNRVSLMDLRTGMPRLMMLGSDSAHAQLLQSYVPRELFAELPLYTALLRHPRQSRRRLVELLQRQLRSPTGYLNTELDTTPQDLREGLVLPHNLTSCQVHPFALFAIFSRQDAVEERVFSSDGRLLDEEEMALAGELDGEEESNRHDGGTMHNRHSNTNAKTAMPSNQQRRHTGVGSNERKVVRAWAEVWTEYRSVVAVMATTPARKRDAMRVLLHGALLLRSAAVAGAQLELNLKVPVYGFPLLASETRVRSSSSSSAHGRGDAVVRAATPESVKKAVSAYKMFFSNAAPSHFPFRPMVGLNGGCDVVFVCGSTLALYDIVTTGAELRRMTLRFAEALLGVVHVLERQVLPLDKVRAVQFVTVVSLDEARAGLDNVSGLLGHTRGANGMSSMSNSGGGGRRGSHVAPMGGLSVDYFRPAASPSVPLLLDYDAIFDDDVIDRLRLLQQSLGMTKDFRTLGELVQELEQVHRLRVTQEVVVTPEEVESLFSPTLLQLVPDATVLPAYTSAVVTAEDLMAQALHGRRGRANNNSGATSFSSSTAAGLGAGAVTRVDDPHRLNLEEDDDDADYVNLGEEDILSGAEVDDMADDNLLARAALRSSTGMDAQLANDEHLHESAELLAAMMNDVSVDAMEMSGADLRKQHKETAQLLRRDLVMEDSINYNAPPPTARGAVSAAAHAHATSSLAAAAAASKVNAKRSAAAEAEADALAWLHDIITPESLVAGMRSTAPGAGTPLSNAVGGGGNPGTAATTAIAVPSSYSPSSPPQHPPQPTNSGQHGVGSNGTTAAVAAPPSVDALSARLLAAAGVHVSEPWTPNVPPPTLVDGTESISVVFPQTAAKRRGTETGMPDGDGTTGESEAVSAAGEEGEGDDDDDIVQPSTAAAADTSAGVFDDEEEQDEEIDLQKLFDQVGRRRRDARTTSAAKGQRRGGRVTSGRRSAEAVAAKSAKKPSKSAPARKSSSSPSGSGSSSKRGRGSGASSTSAAASGRKKTVSGAGSSGNGNGGKKRKGPALAASASSKKKKTNKK